MWLVLAIAFSELSSESFSRDRKSSVHIENTWPFLDINHSHGYQYMLVYSPGLSLSYGSMVNPLTGVHPNSIHIVY